MIFCVPKETLRHEHRVGLTPFGVSRLVNYGHEVYVEHDAGKDSHFADQDFATAGASIVYSREEAFGRADVICRVGQMTAEEIDHVKPGATVMGFLHLAVTPREAIQKAMERGLTMIGYEVIEDADANPRCCARVGDGRPDGRAHRRAPAGERVGRPRPDPRQHPGVPPGHRRRDRRRHRRLDGGADRARDRRARHRARPDGSTAAPRGDPRLATRRSPLLATPRTSRRFTAIADVVIGAVLIPGGAGAVPRDRGDGASDEAGQRDHRRVHRPGRMRRDEPARRPWTARPSSPRGGPLLRAEHDRQHPAHRLARDGDRGPALPRAARRGGDRGGAEERPGSARGAYLYGRWFTRSPARCWAFRPAACRSCSADRRARCRRERR